MEIPVQGVSGRGGKALREKRALMQSEMKVAKLAEAVSRKAAIVHTVPVP